jgi:uncharacterized membrane protein (UPF0182 family)
VNLRRWLLLAFLTAFAAVLFVPTLLGILVDWWWFQEIGYQVVFTRELITQLLLFLIVSVFTFGFLYLNLKLAQRGLVPYPVVLRFAQNAPRLDVTRPLRRLTLPVSLVLSALAGLQGWPSTGTGLSRS